LLTQIDLMVGDVVPPLTLIPFRRRKGWLATAIVARRGRCETNDTHPTCRGGACPRPSNDTHPTRRGGRLPFVVRCRLHLLPLCGRVDCRRIIIEKNITLAARRGGWVVADVQVGPPRQVKNHHLPPLHRGEEGRGTHL